ncbi:MAG: ABC transporter permease [Phycisphaeraceae bacterium]|nr:ABC transporter permease [Phycisphaeraceae bacterium]
MTFVFEIIRLGIKNLGLHKLRSSLTSLGIILGVAAVIIVVSIGEGNKQSTLRQITDLGATNIIIRSQKPPTTQSASTSNTFVVEYGLTRLDLKRLQEFVGPSSDLEATTDAASTSRLRGKHLVPLKAVGSEIRRRNERTVSQVFGTTPDLSRTAMHPASCLTLSVSTPSAKGRRQME